MRKNDEPKLIEHGTATCSVFLTATVLSVFNNLLSFTGQTVLFNFEHAATSLISSFGDWFFFSVVSFLNFHIKRSILRLYRSKVCVLKQKKQVVYQTVVEHLV